MKIDYLIILIGVIALNSGCFTYRSYVPIDLKEVDLNVPIHISNISIEDDRNTISKEDDIKIPFMSGLKRKAWKHHPKLTQEHKNLINNTIYKNFNSNSTDTASMIVKIKYACKEFEQTGKSEIESVYLNIETRVQLESLQLMTVAIDTFHYESMDASNKHFEKFYQTSLRNNLVRCMSGLRDQFYNSEVMEAECYDTAYTKRKFVNNLAITITGKNPIEQIEMPEKFNKEISQNWNFKFATDNKGELTYIQCLNEYSDNKIVELKEIMKYLYNLKLITTNNGNCWNLKIANQEH